MLRRNATRVYHGCWQKFTSTTDASIPYDVTGNEDAIVYLHGLIKQLADANEETEQLNQQLKYALDFDPDGMMAKIKQQAAEIEQLKTNNGKLSATIELRDNVIKQQDAELVRLIDQSKIGDAIIKGLHKEIERLKEKLKAIAEIPASYCGSGASIARITACDKMRQIAKDGE